ALAQINNYHKAALPLLWVIQAFTRDIELYPYFDTTPNSPIRHPQAATFEHQRLLPDGRNLVQVLWHSKNNYPDAYEKILKELWRLNYNNTALQFHRTKEDQLELLFVEEELNFPTSMQQVSDGTLQNLCLLAIHFNPDRGRFICIEKPEHNLPAFGNNYVVNCMYENSYDSTTAFLFTSNKPQLINSLRVHHIITVTKFNQNISEIEIRTEEELKTFYDDDPLSIVKMWNNGEIGG
ncbi:MAG: AAA family ATPase, partial [Bacteroidota bacterium]